MHVIIRKRLNEFVRTHPETEPGLENWYRLIKSKNYDNFSALRADFPAADQVGKLTVFNIGGNKVRLIAAIHYNRRRVYIRAVLTHSTYDKGAWKE